MAIFSASAIFAVLNDVKNISDVTQNATTMWRTLLTQFGATTSLSTDTDTNVSFKPQ